MNSLAQYETPPAAIRGLIQQVAGCRNGHAHDDVVTIYIAVPVFFVIPSPSYSRCPHLPLGTPLPFLLGSQRNLVLHGTTHGLRHLVELLGKLAPRLPHRKKKQMMRTTVIHKKHIHGIVYQVYVVIRSETSRLDFLRTISHQGEGGLGVLICCSP